MTSSTVTGRRGGPVVGFLVLIWVLGLLASAWRLFGIGMRQWADSYSEPSAETAALRHQAAGATLTLALVAVGGPAIIALVAYRLRLVRTAVVFLVLTLALLIPGLPAAGYAYRDLRGIAPTVSGPADGRVGSGAAGGPGPGAVHELDDFLLRIGGHIGDGIRRPRAGADIRDTELDAAPLMTG